MKTPKLWKHLKRHPLSAEYDDLVGDRWDSLVADIENNGFDKTRPIILVKVEDEFEVLDGWQRQRVCVACDVEPAYAELPASADLEAYVRRHNDNRRHETETQRERRVEKQKKDREERRQRVAEARTEGKSVRAIADEENVSIGTVQRDIANSGVSEVKSDTPEEPPKPATVTGRDGKTYAASKPKPAPPPPADDEPPEPKKTKAGKPTLNDKKLLDAYGQLVRGVDAIMPKGRRHARCQDLLGMFLAEYQLWKKENA